MLYTKTEKEYETERRMEGCCLLSAVSAVIVQLLGAVLTVSLYSMILLYWYVLEVTVFLQGHAGEQGSSDESAGTICACV